MTEKGRIVAFVTVVLFVWTLMHVYVMSRVWGLMPTVSSRRWLLVAAFVLWLSYPLGRALAHWRLSFPGYFFEMAGAIWMGALFLALIWLLAVDLVTGFGFLLTEAYKPLRVAALGLTALLSVWGLIQGLRIPAVREEVVVMRGLPAKLDGLVAVQVSDLHLGTLMGRRWLDRLAGLVERQNPDLVLMTGDVVDGGAEEVERLKPQLARFRARLCVWGVTGNHEFYVGLDRSVAFMESCGIAVLRDSAREVAPGLILSGVDDLTARREFRMDGDPLEKALASRPEGATILLSHSPLEARDGRQDGRGAHAVGPYAQRPDMAVWVSRPALLSLYLGEVRGGGHDPSGEPGDGNVGSSHEALCPRRDHKDYAQGRSCLTWRILSLGRSPALGWERRRVYCLHTFGRRSTQQHAEPPAAPFSFRPTRTQ